MFLYPPVLRPAYFKWFVRLFCAQSAVQTVLSSNIQSAVVGIVSQFAKKTLGCLFLQRCITGKKCIQMIINKVAFLKSLAVQIQK